MKLIAFSEFLVNWNRNLFVSIILSVIALTCTTMYGILSYEKSCMAPFEGFEGKQGFYVKGELEGMDLSDFDIYTTYMADIGTSGNSIYCIDEWAYDWKPRLKEGSFLKKINSDGTIPVVVAGNIAERYNIGDTVNLKNEGITLKVSGKLADGSGILGQGNTYSIDTVDYRLYYQTSDSESCFLCAKECLADTDIKLNEAYSKIYVAKDGVSDERFTSVYKDVQLKTYGTCIELSDFMDNCRSVYIEKLLSYMPLIITGVLVVIICCFAAIYINYMHSVKRYTIQYIVGCRPWQMMVINLSNCAGIVLLSVCFTAVLLKVLREQGILSKLTVVADIGAVIALALFYAGFMALMIFITWLSMRGRSPKEQLTRIKG